MDLNLCGRRALVTGASYGIGAAVAEVLAEEGCALHLAARSKSTLDELAQRLSTAHGVEVQVHAVDLRSSADLTGLAEAVPNLDILVNNAGDIPGGPLDVVDEDTWRHAWELKVFGYINLTRLVYARMKADGHGVIINNIGASGERFDFDYIAGSSGNSALMAFTRALGGRSHRDNIRVVGVNPGPVETERIVTLMKAHARSRFDDESRYGELMSTFPFGRAAAPREVADLVAFLASERSGYTTGAVFTVDGGMTAT
jgi:hypothetical protein